MAKTPMMQQYDDAKSACGDAVLLFRMGDFYELFFEDAKLVARVLGLTLTSRDKGENPIPMAGFPHHQLDGYLAKLIAAGYRCAVCEQMEDPKLAKGLVKREVTRIVSPGTVTDDLLLDPKEANFLLAVCEDAGRSAAAAGRLGLAWADLSTGRFLATTIERERLADQIARISPSEVLLVEGSPLAEAMRAKGTDLGRGRRMMLTTRPAWSFGFDEATRALESHFQLHGLSGLGFEEDDAVAIRACGGLLAYLQETQKHSLSHLDHPLPWRRSRTLEIDEATRRSLEITRTLREARREGSLLSVLDRCVTPMGSRLLGDWLANPSTDRERIESRLEAVGFAVSHGDWCDAVRGRLQGIYDVPRLLSRIVAGRATPRDLSFVARTLGSLPEIGQLLRQADTAWLTELNAQFDLAEDVRSVLDLALEEECPIQPREGGFIRAGYSPELDELREMAHGGKRWIAGYQAKIIEETGIANLKVGFNKVFGYYIEATQSQSTKIPANFIRKQTIKNAERYITPELKEYEERVLTADERAKTLEYELFCDLRQRVHDATSRLQGTADVLAALDVVTALADLARRRGYCRPEIVEEPILEIVDGRHPVLDLTEAEGTFVPNDVSMGGEAGIVMLITGPNMAGKSTYIRQVALLTLMAQIGSFIPARSARIGLADRIFARVGASDELSRGQSTFMVEMTETARILNTATARSLVVLDEIGRGTSTYDGVSLAWAIVEHLHDQIGCRTLFATHYHELTDLKQTLAGVRNLNVAVKEWDDQVVFLHKIVPGAADKSYGIHVARLAGVPRTVNERAKQILAQLEDEHLDAEGKPKISSSSASGKRSQRGRKGDLQLTLFGFADHPLLDSIRETDVNRLTPMEALQLVAEWRQRLDSGR